MSTEKTLSLRVSDQGVHWRCFRASCGYGGGPRGAAWLFADKPRREPRYFTRPMRSLTPQQEALIEDKFGICPDILEGYTVENDRFVLGVYGPIGYSKRGVIAYSLSGESPKSITYNEKPAQPFIHYAIDPALCGAAWPDIVIVEDWFSAEKVAATGNAVGVAIMGTHLAQADVSEIATLATAKGARVWLALDRDAYGKTIAYLNQYREQFPLGLYAWQLQRDLKYETAERINDALLDGKTNFLTGDDIGNTHFSSDAKGPSNV